MSALSCRAVTMMTGSSLACALLPDRSQHVEPADARHLDVEQDEREVSCLRPAPAPDGPSTAVTTS